MRLARLLGTQAQTLARSGRYGQVPPQQPACSEGTCHACTAPSHTLSGWPSKVPCRLMRVHAPWSTWPITVTTGGLGTKWSMSSSLTKSVRRFVSCKVRGVRARVPCWPRALYCLSRSLQAGIGALRARAHAQAAYTPARPGILTSRCPQVHLCAASMCPRTHARARACTRLPAHAHPATQPPWHTHAHTRPYM